MDNLTEMHLLLREYGWEPEWNPGDGATLPGWDWTRHDCNVTIFTYEQTPEYLRVVDGKIWSEHEPGVLPLFGREPFPPYRRVPLPKKYFTVAGLEERLKELAHPQTHERPQP